MGEMCADMSPRAGGEVVSPPLNGDCVALLATTCAGSTHEPKRFLWDYVGFKKTAAVSKTAAVFFIHIRSNPVLRS